MKDIGQLSEKSIINYPTDVCLIFYTQEQLNKDKHPRCELYLDCAFVY